jgi:hypothetical protein
MLTATIDAPGYIHLKERAPSTRTATFASFSDTTTLTVVPANLISISVTPNLGTRKVGHAAAAL